MPDPAPWHSLGASDRRFASCTAIGFRRSSRGWTQQELAAHCGLKEQQIQRCEANDYEQASLGRIIELAHALGVDRYLEGAVLEVERS